MPSTQALRVFEVVARYQNCTHAAQELCLTPSAVSKQLQSLENDLGVELFVRNRHGLALTSAGRLYLSFIQPLMARLTEAGERVAALQAQSQDLHLRVPPAFADRWLLPRLSAYTEANPDHRIHIDASAMRDENLLVAYDLYVRFGRSPWPGFQADYLCGRQQIIIASPALLERGQGIRGPADLLRFTRFGHSWLPRGWAEVLADCGVEGDPSPDVVLWDFYSVIIRSACLGHGLGLVPKCFVAEELARGELVQLFGYSRRCDAGYHLVVAAERQDDPSIARFRDWILARRGEGED